jgi:2-polyprenyl-3-methyl-5-hydroxy-6-metoxy-1,4-benzoquinol methylase
MRDIVRNAFGRMVDRAPLPNRVKRLFETHVEGEAQASWYDRAYQRAPKHYSQHYTKSPYYFTWTVIADRARSARSVLEIGSGTGQLAQLLRDQGVEKYVGFYFSREAVAIARQRAPGLDFRFDDARTTQLYHVLDHDLVICTEVLEHIDGDIALLQALKPGIRVIATVPSFDSASHVRYFSDAETVRMRYSACFRTVDVRTLLASPTTKFFLLDGILAG